MMIIYFHYKKVRFVCISLAFPNKVSMFMLSIFLKGLLRVKVFRLYFAFLRCFLINYSSAHMPNLALVFIGIKSKRCKS